MLATEARKIILQNVDEPSDIDELIGCIMETLVLVFPAAFGLVFLLVLSILPEYCVLLGNNFKLGFMAFGE